MGAALIAGAALVAYHNCFTVPLLFDDRPSIGDNPTIRHLWDLGQVLAPPRGHGITVEGRPVLNLSLAINYAISGTNVWSYHVVNVLIHILAGLALFGIVRRTLELFERSRIRENSGGPPRSYERGYVAFLIALLWTVHPLQTESVTYVIQRAESLMGLFYLLTLYCFIRGSTLGIGPSTLDVGQVADLAGHLSEVAYSRHRLEQAVWYALSFLSCFFGMATKEVMVTAPAIVFLYDRTFVAGTFSAAWRKRRTYYLALAATWLLLAYLAIGAGDRGGTIGEAAGVAPWQYLLCQSRAIVHYLRLSIWPAPLVADYGSDFVGSLSRALPYALCDLALLGATAVAVWRKPALGFLGAWFFLILAPTSSFVGGTRQMLAEHRMYLSLAAVVTLLVLGGSKVAEFVRIRVNRRILTNGRLSRFALGTAASAICLAATIVCCGLTLRRNGDYRSELALFQDTVAKRPDNAFARYNLGKALDEAGQPEAAIFQYRAAIRLRPNGFDPHNNLGVALAQTGRFEEAVEEYQTALSLNPRVADAHYNLGIALLALGRKNEALVQFQAAVGLRPDDVEARDNLGAVLLDFGRLPEAMAQFQFVLGLDPNLVETHCNLGTVYRLLGRRTEAIAEFQTALRIDSGFAPARAALRELGSPP